MKARISLAFLLMLPATLMAAERNDLASCYQQAKIAQFTPEPSGRMLSVVVDQTTPLTSDLQRTAWGNIKRFLQPGDQLRLYSFSAYLDGHYMQLQYAGQLERGLDPAQVGDVPMMNAKKLDQCLAAQPKMMLQQFGKRFVQTMGKSSMDIPRSEILFSLKAVGQDIQSVKGVNENVILLMSDMLEYSDFGSFYQSKGIRDISPSVELAKVERENLLADFKGARIYVHGAAFVPTDAKNGYRSGKMIQNLESFWSQYFSRSNGQLVAFGHPELTVAVQ